MAAASLSRRLLRSLLLHHRRYPPLSASRTLCSSTTTTTTVTPLAVDHSDSDPPDPYDSDVAAAADSPESPPPSFSAAESPRRPFLRPLENGLEPGVYRAILVGKVGQRPVQKTLRSGRAVVLFSLGTGGIRNNRRPLDNEEPREYAERCAVQWHRVSVYPSRLGELALNHVQPGSTLYVEGNLETKVFSDPITGLVRRIREIAVRADGRLVFLGNDANFGQSEQGELRSVGYY